MYIFAPSNKVPGNTRARALHDLRTLLHREHHRGSFLFRVEGLGFRPGVLPLVPHRHGRGERGSASWVTFTQLGTASRLWSTGGTEHEREKGWRGRGSTHVGVAVAKVVGGRVHRRAPKHARDRTRAIDVVTDAAPGGRWPDIACVVAWSQAHARRVERACVCEESE